MIESEDGTVTGSIDVNALGAVKPKTDEARAQLEQLRGDADAGRRQTEADADKLAEQSRAQAFLSRDDDGVERVQQPNTTDTVDGDDDGSTGSASSDQQQEDDVDALRAEAEGLGVQVDRRWGANRLRQEIGTAREQAVNRGDDEPA